MYYYVYDTYLSDKKYEKILDKVKTRLLDLEIQGKHERLTLLKRKTLCRGLACQVSLRVARAFE